MTDAACVHLRAMAWNNAWANHRLYEACAQLTPDEFVATRTSFFPSIAATLNHILVIDHFYIDAMEGGRLGPAAWANDMPHPAMADLRPAQVAMDRRLIAICADLRAADLGRTVAMHRGTHIQDDRLDRTLLHLFQHDVHHRGQVHAMLSGTGVTPPQLDEFFMTGEAHLRAAELAAIGGEEGAIWRGLVETM